MSSTNSFSMLIAFQTVAFSITSIAIFVVTLIGWRRNQHLGFLVLMIWAALSATWRWAFTLATPLLQQFGRNFAGNSSNLVVMANVFSGLLLHAVLFFGLWLLVFRRAPAGPE